MASYALHAAGLMRQRAAPRQRTVVIWQAAGGVGHRLEFMYKPVIDTLTDGFTDVPARVLEAVGKPRVVHGYGVRSLSTFAAGLRRELLGSTGHGRDATRALPLGNGDTFVWIGPVGSGTPPWVELRRLGVRTVYFQTEPADGCQFAQSNAQEIWEFSWHNFDACARQLPDGITLRYVPLGFHAPPARELSTTKAALPPRGRHNELLFFGYPFYKSGRGLCYAQLARALGARLNATWMVWTLEDFEAWWATHGQWAAHLNLHKTCENQHNPVVFRTALLLSRGATVLSERAYWRDEQEYAGLVRFGRVQELATMLDAALDSPPGINRGSSAGSVVTTTAMHALQTHAHVAKLYAERFAPHRIFERALVYDSHLLNLSLGEALERRKASSSGLQQQGEGGHSAVAVGTRGPPSLSRARFALGGRARGGRGGSGKGIRDQGNGVHTRNGGGRRGARASSTGKHAFESQAAPTMAPFALLLHGRVGTLMAAPSISIVMSSLRPADYAIPIAACAASHLEHVVRANRAATQGASAGVDIFAHTWNPSVASFFNFEYGSHLRASLHEPLEFKDKEKPRSQALSIGRAAGLMAKHEAMRNRPYAFCLVLRSDLLVGAPILLRDFDRTRVWFAEHCCMNEATSALEKAAVHAKCDSPKFSGWQQNDPRYRAKLTGQFNYRKRILGPCRVTQYGGYWGLQNYKEDYYYALMDWWFAARPEVVKSWIRISDEWSRYKKRLQQLRIARWFSHYLWAIHVHDFLNATSAIRFRAGIRVNLVRHSYGRLRMAPGQQAPLGEYVTDAVGNCDALQTVDNRTFSNAALLRSPVPQGSALAQHFSLSYMPMAEQCALARLADPVVCCGEPRRCGTQGCGSDWSAANHQFRRASRGAVERMARLLDEGAP